MSQKTTRNGPRPFTDMPLPTPRVVLSAFTPLTPFQIVITLSVAFSGLLLASHQWTGITVTPAIALGFLGVTALAIGITRLPVNRTTLTDVPGLDEVYLARRYAQLATLLSGLTVSGMIVLCVLLVFGNTDVIRMGVAPTSETIITFGALTSLASSYGIVRGLLAHAPHATKSSLHEKAENSTLVEVLFTLGLIGCPLFLVGAILWNHPPIVSIHITLASGEVLALLTSATVLYLALVNRF